MTAGESVATLPAEPGLAKWRPYMVRVGQVVLGILLVWLWKWGSDYAGETFIADPFKVWDRLIEIAISGELAHHTYVTLRISAIGFAIGCVAGVLLPFILRRLRHADRL